jgi:hypothetical protein
MEYRGIEYSVVQGIERGVWKWSVNLNKSNIKSGQKDTKQAAINAAWCLIDKALTLKRLRLVLPTSK